MNILETNDLPEGSGLFRLCYCEDEDTVDNLCWHLDKYSSSWHLGKQESESGPSEVASLASDTSLFYFETRPTGAKKVR